MPAALKPGTSSTTTAPAIPKTPALSTGAPALPKPAAAPLAIPPASGGKFGPLGGAPRTPPKPVSTASYTPAPEPGAATQATWDPEQIKAWGEPTGPGGVPLSKMPARPPVPPQPGPSALPGPAAPKGVAMAGKNTLNWEKARLGEQPLLDKPVAPRTTSLNPYDVAMRNQQWRWGEGEYAPAPLKPNLYAEAHKLPTYTFDPAHLGEGANAEAVQQAWAQNPGATAELPSLPPSRVPGMADYASAHGVDIYDPHLEQWWASEGPTGTKGGYEVDNPYTRMRRYSAMQRAQRSKVDTTEGTGFVENYLHATPADVRGDPIQRDYYTAQYEQQGFDPQTARARAEQAVNYLQEVNRNHSKAPASDTYLGNLRNQLTLAQGAKNVLGAAGSLGDMAYGVATTPFTGIYGAATGNWSPLQASARATIKPLLDMTGATIGDPLQQDAADWTRDAGKQLRLSSADRALPWYQRYGGDVAGRTMEWAPFLTGLAAGGLKMPGRAVAKVVAPAAPVVAGAKSLLSRAKPYTPYVTPAATGVAQQGINDVGLGAYQQQATQYLDQQAEDPRVSGWLRALAGGTSSTLSDLNPTMAPWNLLQSGLPEIFDGVTSAQDWAQGRGQLATPHQHALQQQADMRQQQEQYDREGITQTLTERTGQAPDAAEVEHWFKQLQQDDASARVKSQYGVDMNAPQTPQRTAMDRLLNGDQPAAPDAGALDSILQDGLTQPELADILNKPDLRQALTQAPLETQQAFIQHADALTPEGKETLSDGLRRAKPMAMLPFMENAVHAKINEVMQQRFQTQLAPDEIRALLQAVQ